MSSGSGTLRRKQIERPRVKPLDPPMPADCSMKDVAVRRRRIRRGRRRTTTMTATTTRSSWDGSKSKLWS